MLHGMTQMLDALWRAIAYCLHPRVIILSLLPLILASVLTIGVAYFFWETSVAGVRATIDGWTITSALLKWMDSVGGAALHALVAPLIVIGLAIPVVVVVSLLLVSWLMTPALLGLVATRRFPELERKQGAGMLQSVWWTLVYTVTALAVMLVSVPFWFVPPLMLILPPLIWGWLTFRVFSFDVLATHANKLERKTIIREHHWPLLTIGVITGFMGAAPSLIWAVMGAAALAILPVVLFVSVWLYTLVFAVSALWFSHYALAALAKLRAANAPVPTAPVTTAPIEVAVAPSSALGAPESPPSLPLN